MASPMSYLQQIPSTIQPYYQPYMDAGTSSIPTLQDQYTKLLTDPGAVFNQMGQSFQQSPGFDFAMQQALQGSGHAAAAGGMAGSPQHEQQNQELATNLANQDYYNYMNQVTGLYGKGLSGEQDFFKTGFNASKSYSDQVAQALAAQAQLQYQQDAAKKAAQSSIWGDVAGGAATGASYAMMMCSAALKDKVSTPSTKEILNNVRELSLDKWKYKGISQEFLGTYAEEFAERFGVGDGKTINIIDFLGVLLGTVKELDKVVLSLQEKINAIHDA